MKRIPLFVLLVVSIFTSLALASELPAGKFSGTVFYEYYYNLQRDSLISSLTNVATPGTESSNAFQFRRINLAYEQPLPDGHSFRVRLESEAGSATADGKNATYIKDAYFTYKNIFQNSDAQFGLLPSPGFDPAEAAWQHRSIEKMQLDLRGALSSRDMGFALKGKIDNEGRWKYHTMFGNNSSTKNETDKHKRVSFQVMHDVTKSVQTSFYADYKSSPRIADANHAGETLNNDAITAAWFLGYAEPDRFTVGMELFFVSTMNGIRKGSIAPNYSYSERLAQGASVFAVMQHTAEWESFIRLDSYDPNSDSDYEGDSRLYVMTGCGWKQSKYLTIMPNLQYESYEQFPNGGRTPDASITARVTAQVKF